MVAAACALLACRPTPVTGPVSPTLAPTTAAVVPDGAATMPAAAATGGRCDANHDAGLRLFPADASVLGGVNVSALLQAPASAPFLALADINDLKPVLAAASQCGLGRDTWRSITFAGDFSSSKNGIALRADGAGTLDKLECVRARMVEKASTDGFTISTTPAGIELAFADGSHGWVVDPCTVIVVTKDWVAPVRDRMQGAGAAAIDGRLVSTAARADPRKHAWLAMLVDPTVMGSTFLGAQDLAVSVEVTSGLAIAASLAFPDPTSAAKQSAELERMLSGMKSMVASSGVPQSVTDSIKVGPAGSFVMISADADERELAAIAKLMQK
jgi:hypothetical protein